MSRSLLVVASVLCLAVGGALADQSAREVEPNNTAAAATPIPLGVRIEAANPSSGDQDFFRFTLTEAGELRLVTAKPESASAGLAFSLRAAGGGVLQDVDINQAGERSYLTRSLAPGEYILLARNRMMFSGPYWFRLEFIPASAAPAAPAAAEHPSATEHPTATPAPEAPTVAPAVTPAEPAAAAPGGESVPAPAPAAFECFPGGSGCGSWTGNCYCFSSVGQCGGQWCATDAPDSIGAIDPAHPPVVRFGGLVQALQGTAFLEREGKLEFALELAALDLPEGLKAFAEVLDETGTVVARAVMDSSNRSGNQVSLTAKNYWFSDSLPPAGSRPQLPPGRYLLRLLAGATIFAESPFRVEVAAGKYLLRSEIEGWFRLARQRGGWTPVPSTIRLYGVNTRHPSGTLPQDQDFTITLYRGREVVARGTNAGRTDLGPYHRGTSTWMTAGGQELPAGNGFFARDGVYRLEAAWGAYGKWRSEEFQVRDGNPVAQGRQAADSVPSTRRIVEEPEVFWIEGQSIE